MPNESATGAAGQETNQSAATQERPNIFEGGGASGVQAGNAEAASDVQPGDSTNQSGEPGSTIDVLLPAEFKDRGWAKPLAGKSVGDFFKDYDNAQSLLGKKQFGVPDANATDEQQKEFYKALGVPEAADGYEIPKVEWSEEEKVSGEFLAGQRDPEFENEIKQLAFDLKIPKEKLSKLAEGYDRAFVKKHSAGLKAIAQAQEELNRGFDEILNAKYGDKTDEVLANARAIVDKFAPDLKPLLAKADNSVLAGVVELAENIRKTYVSDDDLKSFIPSTDTGSGSGSLESMEAARFARRAQEDFRNPRHPNHAQAKREVDEMTAQFVQAKSQQTLKR